MKSSPGKLLRSGFLGGALLVLLLASSATAGAPQTEALDRAGNVFQVRTASYAQVVPGGAAVAPETPVLVLDVASATGECRHEIVPRSFGWEVDTEERLFLDWDTGTVYVLWVAKGWGTDEVRLSVYRDSAWANEYVLSEDSWAGRRNLDATLNRRLVSPAPGYFGTALWFKVLQLVWWESFNGGGGAPRYVPVFLNADGTIDTTSAVVYDPTAGETATAGCSDVVPEAAFFPTVVTENFELSRVTAWAPGSCGFVAMGVNLMWVPDSSGGERQARHMPFIGARFRLDGGGAMPVAASDSRVSVVGPFAGVYQAALSWTEGASFRYQLWSNASNDSLAWSEVRQIPLSGDMTLVKARALLDTLLGDNR